MNTVSYTYDSNGNMISETEGIETTLYTYDVWGNLVAAGDTTYGYDYAGIRISKNSDQFYNINGVVAIEQVGETVYTSLLGAERIRRNDTLYLYDAHGNVVNLLGSSGIEKVYDYDAYGNQPSIETGDENPFRYCGEYYDEETGFIYLRARYYDSTSGRFISEDTHWNIDNMIYGDNPDKDNPRPDDSAIKQSGNIYAYCMNNPVNYIDRTGNFAILDDVIAAISCAVILVVCTALVTIDSTMSLMQTMPYSTPSFESIPILPFARAISEPKVEEKTEIKTETITIADARRKVKKKEMLIFRLGFALGGAKSLVPTDIDCDSNSGLSFSLIPCRGAAVTTIDWVNSTGLLYAVRNGPNHVSVYPNGVTLKEWHDKGVNSKWTQALLKIIMLVV